MKLQTQWSIAMAAALLKLLFIGGLCYRRLEPAEQLLASLRGFAGPGQDIRPAEDVPSLPDSLRRRNEAGKDSGPWRHREDLDAQVRSWPLALGARDARPILSNAKDSAVIALGPGRRVSCRNGGTERGEEILGKHAPRFYTEENAAIGKPTTEWNEAREKGRFEDDGWRVRKDRSHSRANVVLTPLQDGASHPRGSVKIARDTEKRAYAGRDLSQPPQVILLDLKLPTTNGLEVLECIRSAEATRRLPVVIQTMCNEDQDRLRSYGLGANNFVRKPVELEKFIEAVRQLGLYWLFRNEAAPVSRRA